MQIEQIDRDAAADYLEARGERALALRARNVGGTLAEAFARHRISALSARPASNYVMVREIETVTGDFCTEPGEPFYRIEIDGFCADFDYREAADNFAAAINARIAARPAANVVKALQQALVNHNDVLRSAYQIAARQGNSTDWDGFTKRAGSVLHFHHDEVNAARAAIAAMGSDMGESR